MVVQSEKDELIRQLDELSEDEIRLRLRAGNTYGKWKAAYLESELERRDRSRSDASHSEQTDIARSAKDAAWAAADAAREANRHAKSANRIATIALIIAIVTAIASGVLWWMDHSSASTKPKASALSSTSPEA
jgi:hypothetical protein